MGHARARRSTPRAARRFHLRAALATFTALEVTLDIARTHAELDAA
jgi:hypothetical protein